MMHVISTLCAARDLHMTVPGPLEHTCWRSEEIWNCPFQIDYFNIIIIIITTIMSAITITIIIIINIINI